jgi:hypothetical protein
MQALPRPRPPDPPGTRRRGRAPLPRGRDPRRRSPNAQEAAEVGQRALVVAGSATATDGGSRVASGTRRARSALRRGGREVLDVLPPAPEALDRRRTAGSSAVPRRAASHPIHRSSGRSRRPPPTAWRCTGGAVAPAHAFAVRRDGAEPADMGHELPGTAEVGGQRQAEPTVQPPLDADDCRGASWKARARRTRSGSGPARSDPSGRRSRQIATDRFTRSPTGSIRTRAPQRSHRPAGQEADDPRTGSRRARDRGRQPGSTDLRRAHPQASGYSTVRRLARSPPIPQGRASRWGRGYGASDGTPARRRRQRGPRVPSALGSVRRWPILSTFVRR